ncbi:Uncharacterized protein SCF082_LOCUS43720 [Durusdinium trenchii]|uniref:Uncharacterized protein n=1 Tax=Durusdinium trenchii TaxID=1381693 RepID=A0ABP0QZU9_9DINO
MPLPYREASFAAKEEEMPDRNDLPRKQAMNVIVLALNFLAAGRSLQPPVLMGRRLNPRQWRAVRRMELFLEAWLHVSPIGPSEMGRTAGKVESIEDQLLDLTQRAKILSQYKNQYFGSPDLSSQKGDPNVRRGTVVGQLAFDPMTTFKRLLSILDGVFQSYQCCTSHAIVRLDSRTKSDLLLAAVLLPLAATNLRARLSERITATDASDWGEAAACATMPGTLAQETYRSVLRKSVWARLLGPAKAWLRGKGMLDVAEELPEGKAAFEPHPIWSSLAECLQYNLVFKRAKRRPRHINIGEVQAFLKAEEIHDTLISSVEHAGAFVAVGMGPVCSSFSLAITPPVRTREHPMGLPEVSEKMREKIELGNSFALWCFDLLRRACQLGLAAWLENPHTSWMFRIPAFWDLLQSVPELGHWVVDYCRFNRRWRKRTRFVCNTLLTGHKTLCTGGHEHILLRGRSAFHRKSWTMVAQPYPPGVAYAVAASMALTVGLRSWEGRFDPAACAKITNCRVGEASKPGPPRKNRTELLEDVLLVEPRTAALQSTIFAQFVQWLESTLSEGSIYLIVDRPKSRNRGTGRVQHSSIRDREFFDFLFHVFGPLEADQPIFNASPSAFRRRWDALLKALFIPKSAGLTPGGLRAGGCVSAFQESMDIRLLMWRMRVRHQITLESYLQEVTASSVIPELEPRSRKAIAEAANVLPFLLSRYTRSRTAKGP